MMSRVYSLKTVSTSDGRCMEVCFSISEEKKNITEEEKDLLCWSSIAVLRATKSSRFTCFNVSRNVRYTLLLYIRSLSCPKLTAMFFYDSSDI